MTDPPPKTSLAERAAAKRAEAQAILEDIHAIHAPVAPEPTETPADVEGGVLAQPMTEEASAALALGMSVEELRGRASDANVTKVQFASALQIVPADVTARVQSMTDAERYTLAVTLGLV